MQKLKVIFNYFNDVVDVIIIESKSREWDTRQVLNDLLSIDKCTEDKYMRLLRNQFEKIHQWNSLRPSINHQ